MKRKSSKNVKEIYDMERLCIDIIELVRLKNYLIQTNPQIKSIIEVRK